MNKMKCLVLIAVSFVLIWRNVSAQQTGSSYLYVPETVSKEWQAFLKTMPDPKMIPPTPPADNKEAWKLYQKSVENFVTMITEPEVKRQQANVTQLNFRGVPVLDVKSKDWKDNGMVVVYLHGGCYTLQSAKSSLVSSSLMANRTGLRIISVDYTLAPHAKWQQITDEVITVITELKKTGYSMKNIAIAGDSAGGGLAAGVVLKMREKGMEMPAAVVLWSPWADITETGDTYFTLKNADPSLIYENILKNSAEAYAGLKDQKNPYVSPVYGDYSKGFPPTLIQGGTKEIFLSNFIRLYQALDTAGQTVKLDIYEGMVHVFQVYLPDSPESKTALKKVDSFLKQYLGK